MPPQPPAAPLPHLACPRCGAPNHCAPAACGGFDVDCWCTKARISRRALSEIPADFQGKACLCAACAALPDPGPATA